MLPPRRRARARNPPSRRVEPWNRRRIRFTKSTSGSLGPRRRCALSRPRSRIPAIAPAGSGWWRRRNWPLLQPLLVGPPARIRSEAEKAGLDISAFPIIESQHSHDSAAKAVGLVREGRAEALMKGGLHTDELMGAVVSKGEGLRTARRISHCFVMDVPGHPKRLSSPTLR